MKKEKLVMLVIGIIAFILLAVGLFLYFRKDNEEPKTPENITEIIENGTEKVQGDFEVTGLVISTEGSMTAVKGTVKNTSDKKQDISLTFMLRNIKSGNMNGINEEILKNVDAGESKEFTVSIMGDYGDSDIYEVRANPYVSTK